MEKCKGCGGEFVKTNPNQKFCSKECRLTKSICINCGNEFNEYKQNKKFCSQTCYGEYTKKHNLKKQTCEWCKTDFENREKRRFCSVKCMHSWRTDKAWTESVCQNKKCGQTFKHRKKEKRMFCSENCMRTSEFKQESARQQMLKINPMSNSKSIQKIKETKQKKYGDSSYNNMNQNRKTKLERYGDEYYNNKEKAVETFLRKYGVDYPLRLDSIKEKRKNTLLEKYGVENVFQLDDIKKKIKETLLEKYGVGNATSLQTRISKPQVEYYEKVKQQYPDAILEHYLKDVDYSVDIFIPSENKVIEVYGDYWHCNPTLYESTYYHKQLHMKAVDKWKMDEKRRKNIEKGGYLVEIIWESQI